MAVVLVNMLFTRSDSSRTVRAMSVAAGAAEDVAAPGGVTGASTLGRNAGGVIGALAVPVCNRTLTERALLDGVPRGEPACAIFENCAT